MNKKIYINLIKPYLSRYCVLFASVVLVTLISLYQPIIFKNLLDSSLELKDPKKLLNNAVLLIFIFILGQIIYYIQNITVTKIGDGVLKDIRFKVLESIIYKPIYFFNVQRTGESMNILLSEIATIVNFMLSTSLGISSNIISIVLSISIITILDLHIALSVIVTTIIYLYVITKQNRIVSFFEQNLLNSQILLSNTINEILTNIRTIKYLNIYNFIVDRFSMPNEECYEIKVEYAYKYSKIRVLLSVICFIPTITLMTYGMYRVSNGNITIGSVFAISNLLNIFMGAVKQLQTVNTDYQQFLIMSRRLTSIIEDINIDLSEELNISEDFTLNIRKLSFGYEDRIIIDNLNDTFKSGDVIQIKGDNGSGKTSFINLISGIETPKNGGIYFDDRIISDISSNSLKNIIGIVPQQIHLFSGTIRENIVLDRNINDSDIIDLISELGFSDIRDMLYNKIHEKGSNLSEGQKQKIAIVRGIISNPYVLILDEASSALDKNSKQDFYNYIQKTRSNRITLIITHDSELESAKVINLR